MKRQVINNVSAVDIQIVQATLIIPLAITGVCSTFDILFHIRLGTVGYEVCEEWVFWILGTLISYFFPSFLASAGSLVWQYYFTDNWSGVKEEKGLLLFFLTLIYFVIYIVYLLFANTRFIYVFAIINVLYVWLVMDKCIDEKILKRFSNRPKNKVKNVPF